jgi:hypothetical protein
MTWATCSAGAARSSPEPTPPSFVLQRILLVPLLSPLLAVCLVAALNPRPWVSVRLLIWSSPSGPLGGWLATAAGLGAAVSGAGTALALQGQGVVTPPRRHVRRRGGADAEPERTAAPEEDRWPSEPRAPWDGVNAPWAGPSRGASEPAPTVSVPFRVIRKGKAAPASTAGTTGQPKTPAAANPAPAADDWSTAASDDW